MTGKETSTLERLVPDHLNADDVTGLATYNLHLERYQFATRFISSGRVLDCACGVGYGAHLIATTFPHVEVVGIDISEEAISYATSRYQSPNLRFVLGDGAEVNEGDFDVIVSLETVEHVPDPEAFLKALVGRLRQGGVLVCSVPVTPSMDANPHHLSDFTKRSIRSLTTSLGLEEFSAFEQVQPYNPFAVAMGTEPRLQDMRKGLLSYYMTHPGKFFLRAKSVIFDGFNNKYLTIATRKK